MLRTKLKRKSPLIQHEVPVDTSHKKKPKQLTKPLGAKSDEAAEKLLKQIVLGGDEILVDKLHTAETAGNLKKKKKRKKKTTAAPKWADEDDNDIILTLPTSRKDKDVKLQEVTGKEYVTDLKKKFEKVAGQPTWAKLRWQRDDIMEDDPEEEMGDLLRSTGDYLGTPTSLPSERIEMKRCTNINKEQKSKVGLKSVEFHPTAQVALTASVDQTLSLFQVDGVKNAKIQSVFLEDFPINMAHFTAEGNEVIMGSRRHYFYYYDMIVGKVAKVSAFPALVRNLANFKVSPDGRFLAFLGKYGYLHLISAKTKELICNLKTNNNVCAAAFSSDGQHLYTHGDDGEVYVWNMATRDCIHRFCDDGCITGTAIAASKDGRYIATGSKSGVVNIYDESCLTKARPIPVKAIMNLTTSCTSLVFNSTTEILAASSNQWERAVKLVHLSSRNVFSNFPAMSDNFSLPCCLDFSVNSGYLTIGNNRGMALLYRVNHYKNY